MISRQTLFLSFLFFFFSPLLFFPQSTAAQITLAWDPNPEPISGYKIYCGVDPGSYYVHIDVGNVTQYPLRGLVPGNTYYFAVSAYNAAQESSLSNEVAWTYKVADTRPLSVSLGIFRQGMWYFDQNSDGAWNDIYRVPRIDQQRGPFGGFSTDIPVIGNWTGNGRRIGIYRSGDWFFDQNGNGAWDNGIDIYFHGFGGLPEDIPVAGDWTGNGTTNIGIYRSGEWFLDNGNGRWEGCNTDFCLGPFGGFPGDVPVTGDWTGDGLAKIGIYRNGQWFLDQNGNGNWDGCGIDTCWAPFGGLPGDLPVVGDWNGDGRDKIGIFRSGMWYLDFNGNGKWDDCGIDKCAGPFGGYAGDLPMIR